MNNTMSYSTLLAGVTGSGKSFAANKIIQHLIHEANALLVLIDPKKVEQREYRLNPATLWYADDEDSIYETFCKVHDLMFSRLDAIPEGEKVSSEPHTFVCVDEMAFLMQSSKKRDYVKMIGDIAIMGRAAHIHLVLCTQVCTQDVIPAVIRDNVANIVCLRQRDAGKYRYLLGSAPGRLPLIGYAYVLTPNMDRPEKVAAEDIWKKIGG